jgi:CheY-like chemotaxis protein
LRILVIEDDSSQSAALVEGIASVATVVVAGSQEDAVAAMLPGSFDLVVCDLRVPSRQGALDAAETRGLALISQLRAETPGTPVIVFSAHGDNTTVLKGLLGDARLGDPFGAGHDRPMLIFIEKSALPECVKLIRESADQLAALAQIGISSGTKEVKLDDRERKVLQLFARVRGGAEIRVSELAGGLTGARTLRVLVSDPFGAQRARVVAKIDKLEQIYREQHAYDDHIASVLASGAFTPRTYMITSGAGDMGGIFYTLEDDVGSLMEFALAESDASAAAVTHLKNTTAHWLVGAHTETTTIGAIREMLVAGKDLAGDLLLPSAAAFEAREVRVYLCSQHGDMHGFNVLIRPDGQPILIDFRSATRAPAALDPITLELAGVFHPGAPRTPWPTVDQCRQWRDIDAYVRDCPYAPLVRACRNWAYAVAASDREVHATLYAYSVRQLRFADTRKDLAVALAQAAIEAG